eukprot:g68605.t1
MSTLVTSISGRRINMRPESTSAAEQSTSSSKISTAGPLHDFNIATHIAITQWKEYDKVKRRKERKGFCSHSVASA